MIASNTHITLYRTGGGGGEQTHDQHNTSSDPDTVDTSSDGLTQSRSIDHLLSGAGKLFVTAHHQSSR